MTKYLCFLWVTSIVLLPSFASGQPIQMLFLYNNVGNNTPLTIGCDSEIPFPDGYPIAVYWDRTANGPDESDEIVPIGDGYAQGNLNAFPFNGSSSGFGEGFFFSAYLVLSEPPMPAIGDFPAYYLKISGENCCWTTTTHLFSTGYNEWALTPTHWTCTNQSCITGELPDPPTEVEASDNEFCLLVETTWNHSRENVSGFCIYVDNVLETFSLSWIDSIATVRVTDTEPHTLAVTALNAVGQSEPVTDEGRTYVRRFVPGPNGDVDGVRDPGEELTLELDIPLGICPAATWLFLLVDGAVHSQLVAQLEPDSAFIDFLTFTLPSPPVALENCQIMLKDSSREFPVVSFDTTASTFTILATDAEEGNSGLPASFQLLPAYPNPFNATVNIPFVVPQHARVRLEIVNLLGQHVADIADREFAAGRHAISWWGQSDGGTTVGSGIYFCRLTTESFSDASKIIYLK